MGSNECPAGSVRIETEAACKNAAAALGKDFFGALISLRQELKKRPRGAASLLATKKTNTL